MNIIFKEYINLFCIIIFTNTKSSQRIKQQNYFVMAFISLKMSSAKLFTQKLFIYHFTELRIQQFNYSSKLLFFFFCFFHVMFDNISLTFTDLNSLFALKNH